MAAQLPEGFVLDQPAQGQLPEGFVLDGAATPTQETQAQQPQSVSRKELLKAQATVAYPEAESGLDAFLEGAKRGVTKTGQGVMQRALEVGEFFGIDNQKAQEELKLAGDIEEQKLKGTKEIYPWTTGAGEIAGDIASFPVAAARLPQAVAVGSTYGLTRPTESGGEIAANVALEGVVGGIGSWAAPYIQKGFNKSQAMFSGIYKKATGQEPTSDMFTPEGNLNDQGRAALDDLNITEDDFSRIYQETDVNLDPIAQTRIARAEEQGIPLTTAQATKDFGQQEAEQTLRSGLGREAEGARAQAEAQQEAIRGAQSRFEGSFGEVADRETRGASVQQTLRELESEGRKDVSALYEQAQEIGGEQLPLNNEALLNSIDEEMLRPVDDSVVNSLEKLMAKYGLIEGEISQAGRFNQVIDSEGNKVKFRGDQTPLTLDNAEAFRQGLNQIRGADKSGAISQVIKSLDAQVDEVVGELADGSARTAAFQEARRAAREQKKTFSQKDIIQNIAGYKKGTQTDLIQPDRVIDSVLKGSNSLGNMRRIKDTLTKNNPTNKSLDAWKSIQAQGVADLFSKSINPATGDISGQRLKTAIKAFGGGNEREGKTRLKVLLGDRYKEFNNIVESIGDATIPVKGTTNPSGTAYKLINMMTRVGTVGTFGADAVASLASKAKDSAQARKTLRNIEKASPEKRKQAVKANDDLIDAFVRLGLTGTLRDTQDKVSE